jgi:hypothetical protein
VAPADTVEAEELLGNEPDALEEAVKEWSVPPSRVDYEDPLLSCLALVAGLLERPISREALKSGLPRAAEEFTPELAIRAADRAGLTAKVMRRPKLSQIPAVSLPCILLLKARNACVLTGFPDSKTAEVMVAEGGGTRSLPISELEEDYTGHAIFLRPEFKFDARASDIRLSNPRRWFWGTLAQFWPIYSHQGGAEQRRRDALGARHRRGHGVRLRVHHAQYAHLFRRRCRQERGHHHRQQAAGKSDGHAPGPEAALDRCARQQSARVRIAA